MCAHRCPGEAQAATEAKGIFALDIVDLKKKKKRCPPEAQEDGDAPLIL